MTTELPAILGVTDVARRLGVAPSNLDRDYPDLPVADRMRPGKGRFWYPETIEAYAERKAAEKQEAKT